jgi:hypothetical protein
MTDVDLVTALAAAIGLPLNPAHREGVALNLARLLTQGDIVLSVPLPPDTEPAPIFRP